jgi:N-acylneuraminate cytidylyltransferase
MDTIAIIPARSGSKGIPGKNIVELSGHPLIAYSIIAAQKSKSIGRVIVSTDSHEIADIARRYGAEVPFLRPAEYAKDVSIDREFLLHAVEWLAKNEAFYPEYLVQLRPTTPLRNPDLIDEAVRLIKDRPQASSLRSAHLSQKMPYKWFEMDSRGYFQGIRPFDTRPEYYNLPRQSFPEVYDPNGYVDIIRRSQLISANSVHGSSMLGFITDRCYDIDCLEDLELLAYWVKSHGSVLIPHLQEKINMKINKNK